MFYYVHSLMAVTKIMLAMAGNLKPKVIENIAADNLMYLSQGVFRMKDVGAWNNEQGINLLDGGAPFYSLYKCKDPGQYFTIAGIEMKFWANTMNVMKEKCGLTEEHFEYFTDS